MKKAKMSYVMLGFIVGVAYIAACGSGSGPVAGVLNAASNLMKAIEVGFDNATSGLESTTVQSAIDELAARDNITGDQLVGKWTGTMYNIDYWDYKITITFHADNTYEYGYYNKDGEYIPYLNEKPKTYFMVGRTLVLDYFGTNSPRRMIFDISRLTNDKMALNCDGYLYDLTKEVE